MPADFHIPRWREANVGVRDEYDVSAGVVDGEIPCCSHPEMGARQYYPHRASAGQIGHVRPHVWQRAIIDNNDFNAAR